LDWPDIIPSTKNGVSLAVLANGVGPSPGTPVANQVFDTVYYTGETDVDHMDEADGFSHYYYNSAPQTTIPFGWYITAGTGGDPAASAYAFKAAPVDRP
jgi:hypothetical protein